MQNDWESKFYREVAEIKNIEEKIKRLRSDYSKLTDKIESHDAVVAEQKEVATKLIVETLRTQRFLADFMVTTQAQFYRIFINEWLIENKSNVDNQLVDDSKKAKDAIRVSKDPISIATKFISTWEHALKGLGVPMTRI
jgi:hypothetical protein